jgi:hypothetical protein
MGRLTIGMPTYDDFDGVYFTIQALRMYHPEVRGRVEYVIVDNNPGGMHGEMCDRLALWIRNRGEEPCRYVPLRGSRGTAPAKNAVFEHAETEYVLCTDCHVLFEPGAIHRLIDHFDADPGQRDILQGVLVYDDLRTVSTHFTAADDEGRPLWSDGMWGQWATDPRGADSEGTPFEIGMQGMGVFACTKTAWPGFNPRFQGFGGEEGYIQERIRRNGGRALCLPFLRWLHRFPRAHGVPYPNVLEERLRNYLIGFRELGLDEQPAVRHFTERLGADKVRRLLEDLDREGG